MNDTSLVKRPIVARPAQPASATGFAVTLALVGVGIFLWLSEARAAQEAGDGLPLLVATSSTAPQPMVQFARAPTAAPFVAAPNGPVTLVASPAPQGLGFATPSVAIRSSGIDRANERLRAPTLIVDLAQADSPRPAGSTASDSSGRSSVTATVADRNLNDTERFADRVGNAEVEIARAERMTGLDRLVPQGAVIGAVMETALNSDLPGFARAITTRNVYSFDGSAVLIPAGSRVIGQYKSGIAQGASRVFVLWTRLIRPDGVSIELASPATDDLGRGGIGGKVNRHFLQRFGGAILTSVLTGGISAATAAVAGGSTILVGSAGQASNLAGQASNNGEIPPTITTRQGAPVRIFVARDLDFSRVGPAQ